MLPLNPRKITDSEIDAVVQKYPDVDRKRVEEVREHANGQ